MSDLKERKPDGGLAEWIETLEAMGGEDDAEMLCLLIELRRHRLNGNQLEAAQQRIAELEAELARRDAAAGEPVAVVGSDFSLFWAGSGPIAPLIERHNIKVGARLFTAAQPSALPPTDEQLKEAIRAWNRNIHPSHEAYNAMRKALGFTVEGE